MECAARFGKTKPKASTLAQTRQVVARIERSRNAGAAFPDFADAQSGLHGSSPARQQRQRVVALDPAQVGVAEAELAQALVVFPPEAEREIGAPQDLRDRHHPGECREA